MLGRSGRSFVSIPCRDLCRLREQFIQGLTNRRFHSALLERFKHSFGWYVADQHVLRERASAEAADGGIKATRTRVVCCEKFLHSFSRPRMQMNADIEKIEF